jgi:hypothetical protein
MMVNFPVFRVKDKVSFLLGEKKKDGEILDVSSNNILVFWIEQNKKHYCSIAKKDIISHYQVNNWCAFFQSNICYIFLILSLLLAFSLLFFSKRTYLEVEKKAPINSVYSFIYINMKNAFGFINSDE